MTTNFGCERRTMASQPSLYNEERNLLRIRAWEQRNQETSQDKELNPENVPLFAEPYKTNKGDELSSRIQRMLGSYEDENNPYPSLGNFARDPLSISPHVTLSQSDQGQPNTDKSAKPPFHNHTQHMSTQTQKGPSNNSNHFSQLLRKSTVPAPPNHHGPSPTYSQASLNHSQADQLSYSAQAPDLRECASLPQVLSALSPDAESIPCLHSSDHGNSEPQDMDNKDTFERHQQHGSPAHPSTMDVSLLDPQQSPKDASLPQPNKGTTLPSQTFPPLLTSKAPNVVMTQKPTAYVRPMDGQDQVVSETPELKPSPKPYESLPKINKSNLAKLKILPQFLETRTNEAQCVEDILREMTHSWPPLLTAIHTPCNAEPFKSPFPAKQADHVPSAYPGEKHNSSPTPPSNISQQSSSSTVEAAHFSGVDSASSTDSESTSESDSESSTEEPPQPLGSRSTQTKPDVPAVTHGEWQLGNWIRSSQQNSSTESQGDAHASERPTQSSKATKGEVANPTGEYKPHLSSLQNEFSDNHAKPQQCNEGPQNNNSQESGHKSPSTNLKSTHTNSRKTSDHKHSSKPAKAVCPEDPQPGLQVESVEVLATRVKDPSFTDRPKVKTKTGHSKNNSNKSCTKMDSKNAAKHTLFDKRKAESEPGPKVSLVLYGHCPTCGVRTPSPCSCLNPSPAQPDQLPPTPPVKISCKKVKTETVSQKGLKKPHKSLCPPAHQHSAKASWDPHRPPGSLLVKINLSLLLRVPQVSKVHQVTHSSGKRLATLQDGGGNEAFTKLIRTKTSKKRPAEADSKILTRKKQKLENDSKITPLSHASTKAESSTIAAEKRRKGKGKKAKKDPVPLQQPPTTRYTAKGSAVHKHGSSETQESSMGAGKSRDTPVKHKKSTGKRTEHSNFGKKAPKSSSAVPPPTQTTREALTIRPLLRFEDRKYPVKHYMKEAKKLKHKADAESDKVTKAYNYLDAAMYFAESGIAMEIDPQTPTFSYTMFAETVELLKFVLKLKNSVDASSPPSEKDFIVLCMKCQSLLQMAMFRYKHKTALKYSKTLTDHFKNSKPAQEPSLCASKSTDAPSPMPDMPSPASIASSSGFGSNHSGGEAGGSVVSPVSSTVAIPQVIQQVAVSYVNMTSLFLNAHDIWEQAEELAHGGSGMLSELDTAMGPVSLTSSISSLVRYTRQGVHWLRLDSQKAK